MTAAAVPVPARAASPRARHVPLALPWRLLRLELRRSVMLWMLPLVVALFWFDTYRGSVMPLPPLWGLRAGAMQQHSLIDFCPFVAGGAAWMGSRDARRRTRELVSVTALPRWGRQLATWAAAASWTAAVYLGCVAALYAATARQAAWGGPLWWPVAVGAAGVAAASALGFAAGALCPSRFTAPLAAVVTLVAMVAAFKAGLTSHATYGLVSPLNLQYSGGWYDAGIFYPYLPGLPMDQVLFLAGLAAAALGVLGLPRASGGRTLRRAAAAVTVAGLAAAGTAVGLAGTARLEAHGIVIPALDDAAGGRPVPYTPVCGSASVPICLHPAYRPYLPAVTAALGPVLSQVTGLPGAPVRVDQVPTASAGNQMAAISGRPPVLRLPLGDLGLPGSSGWTGTDFAVQLRLQLADAVVGVGSPAQQAVRAALLADAGVPLNAQPAALAFSGAPGPAPGAAVYAAARGLAALPAAARHAWLAAHLAALRAGHISLEQIP